MIERLIIEGGHVGQTPLEIATREVALVGTLPDSGAVARCPEAIRSVVELCNRFDQDDIVLPPATLSRDGYLTPPKVIATPLMVYKSTQSGRAAPFQLSAEKYLPEPGEDGADYPEGYLVATLWRDALVPRPLYQLGNRSFTITLTERRQGTLGELNQFTNLLEKIKQVTPKA